MCVFFFTGPRLSTFFFLPCGGYIKYMFVESGNPSVMAEVNVTHVAICLVVNLLE